MRSVAFRAIWTAELASVLGDQLAKVVIALLVYARTGSAAASGIAYGLTFLPPLVTGGLSWLADRLPRRDMLVVCYFAQATVVAAMALPGLPVPVLVTGAMVVAGIQNLSKAAQGPLVLDVVGERDNNSARSRLSMFRELGQCAGLAGAAAVVVAIGTTSALLLDSLSFVIAAVLVGIVVPRMPKTKHARSSARAAFLAVLADARGDRTVALMWVLLAVIGFTVALEAVVVPYVEDVHAPTWTVGVLLATNCAGYVVGAWWLGRLDKDRQRDLLLPLVTVSLVPLIAFAVPLPWWIGAVLLAVSGAGSAYLPIAGGEMLERTPDARRGMVSGLGNVVVRVSQGVAAIVVGVLAQALTAAMAVAVAGLCGIVVVAACVLSLNAGHSRSRLGDSRSWGSRRRSRTPGG